MSTPLIEPLQAALVLGSPQWLWLAGVLLAAGLLTALWNYRRAQRSQVRCWIGFSLKVVAFALLGLCLIEPLWSGTRPRPGANVFVILGDNSQGMTIRDGGLDQPRSERVRAQLVDDRSAWQTRLQQDFDVRRFAFDARLKRLDSFAELSFTGSQSALGSALDAIRDRFAKRPLAGVLLFTDGNPTDGVLDDRDTSGWPPVFPVVIGTKESARDLSIEDVAVRETSFEDAPVSAQVEVKASGYAGSNVTAQLLDAKGELVKEHIREVADDDATLSFRFQWRPVEQGVSFFTARVSAVSEVDQFDQPKKSREATLHNNARKIVVDCGRGPYRVLYVSGRPNWEFKFLNRSLESDEQVELSALMRIAKREARFEFRGRTGESANAIFRGFEPDEEEAERYDQPVLVTLYTRNEGELRDGFPKSAKELYDFHALIIDDLEAGFFTHDQMALINRFVSERGGGFLMLGGLESLAAGEYDRTPIGDLLPAYLDRLAQASVGDPSMFELTREGWHQPWVRLRDNESDEQTRLSEMPPFLSVNRVRSLKPGAQLLATVTDKNGEKHPALAVQRFGRGRSAVLTVGDLWRWGLRQDPESRDLSKTWRQMVRWLIADVPNRVNLRTRIEKTKAHQPSQISCRVYSDVYEPLDNAAVSLQVKLPDGETLTLPTESSTAEAGVYETTFIPRLPGAYRATAKVVDVEGEAVGETESGWVSDPAAEEFRSVVPDFAAMRRLAEKTGGEMVDADDLEQFVAGLSRRDVPITEHWTFPLWHTYWAFTFALACLAGEWGLRRVKGLA